MSILFNMPLDDFIDKSLRGETRNISEKTLYSYIEKRTNRNKENLRQSLSEIDDGIAKWKENYFISTYNEKVSAVSQGGLSMTSGELDDVYEEERFLLKEGKTMLTADFLYGEIAKYDLINEHHRDAIESAWYYHDVEFLRTQWECLVLTQIISLRDIICEMLGTAATPKENKCQKKADRLLKQVDDYPEIFDIDTCCEFIGYTKNTIYKWTAKNEIPFHRSGSKGRKLRFKRDEVLEWVLARRQETIEEFNSRMEKELSAQRSNLL